MSERSEPTGCLAAILGLFGIRLGESKAESDSLPYRLRDDFLSPAELSFYGVLRMAVGQRAVICPKVNLGDLFFVARSGESQRYRSKIDRKHVDFLLCAPGTMKPLCGVELDDSSHERPDRQDRDRFVDRVFNAAGLALVHVPARSSYSPQELQTILEQHLVGTSPARPAREAPPEPSPAAQFSPRSATPRTGGSPTCPKCGVPMVLRTVKSGPHEGKSFFGCPNYPRCRQTA